MSDPNIHDGCEYDCKEVCIGCDEYFHNIKTENDLPHDEELGDSLSNNAGEVWCHPDCHAAYWGL